MHAALLDCPPPGLISWSKWNKASHACLQQDCKADGGDLYPRPMSAQEVLECHAFVMSIMTLDTDAKSHRGGLSYCMQPLKACNFTPGSTNDTTSVVHHACCSTHYGQSSALLWPVH